MEPMPELDRDAYVAAALRLKLEAVLDRVADAINAAHGHVIGGSERGRNPDADRRGCTSAATG